MQNTEARIHYTDAVANAGLLAATDPQVAARWADRAAAIALEQLNHHRDAAGDLFRSLRVADDATISHERLCARVWTTRYQNAIALSQRLAA